MYISSCLRNKLKLPVPLNCQGLNDTQSQGYLLHIHDLEKSQSLNRNSDTEDLYSQWKTTMIYSATKHAVNEPSELVLRSYISGENSVRFACTVGINLYQPGASEFKKINYWKIHRSCWFPTCTEHTVLQARNHLYWYNFLKYQLCIWNMVYCLICNECLLLSLFRYHSVSHFDLGEKVYEMSPGFSLKKQNTCLLRQRQWFFRGWTWLFAGTPPPEESAAAISVSQLLTRSRWSSGGGSLCDLYWQIIYTDKNKLCLLQSYSTSVFLSRTEKNKQVNVCSNLYLHWT